ncbi:hypothetical protein THF1D04_20307 [Vibrio owensii]|uniref:Uncharacterized protein n=1 Tax=Vibrio owensii TaxID=696485 RepID=A0AAU9Q3S2_9VIBR|nr:hypothetical protein THF1D04_20307 [Vibrio owensii]
MANKRKRQLIRKQTTNLKGKIEAVQEWLFNYLFAHNRSYEYYLKADKAVHQYISYCVHQHTKQFAYNHENIPRIIKKGKAGTDLVPYIDLRHWESAIQTAKDNYMNIRETVLNNIDTDSQSVVYIDRLYKDEHSRMIARYIDKYDIRKEPK